MSAVVITFISRWYLVDVHEDQHEHAWLTLEVFGQSVEIVRDRQVRDGVGGEFAVFVNAASVVLLCNGLQDARNRRYLDGNRRGFIGN